MDSGYIIMDFHEDMLRFNENGDYYFGEGSCDKYYFYEEDGGCFSQHITSELGWGSHYRCMPVVAWNYIVDGKTLNKLITGYNDSIGDDHGYSRHPMFADKLEKIDEGMWCLVWEDYS